MVAAATYTFSLETERILPPIPNETPAQVEASLRFGAPFGGDFTFRHPTIGEDMRISAAVTGYFEAQGVTEMMNVQGAIVLMAFAFAFFDVVGDDVPKWFRDAREQPATPELKQAIGATYRLAQERIAAKKNGTGNDGGS